MRKTFGGRRQVNRYVSVLALLAGLAPAVAAAATATIPMNLITPDGPGASIGVVRAEDTPQGLTLTPDLTGLPPGEHGFHIHQNPDCGPGMKDGKPGAGLSAGGHWDPENKGKHLGPKGEGHKGDLPELTVASDGTARAPVTVPGLSVANLAGHSLMIHAGGDNYSDDPQPLGGGGARIACGVVK